VNVLAQTFILFAFSTLFYYVITFIYNEGRKRITCSLTIQSSDDVYKMTLNYLTQKGHLKGSMTQMKCQIKKKEYTWWFNRSKEESQKPQIEFLPGPGNHFFHFHGKKMWAITYEGETLLTGWEKKPTKQETLSIMCYGQDTKPLRELVQEAIDFAQEKETDLVKIYQVHRWGDMWDECQQKKPRPINSVILDSNITETVI